MPGDFRPRNWTQRARNKGGLIAIVAIIVVASYAWVNSAWLALIFLDAVAMVNPGTSRHLDPIWAIVGLVTLVALPVFAVDRIAAWRDRREQDEARGRARRRRR